MTWSVFAALRGPILAATEDADALVIRMDASLWMMEECDATPAARYAIMCPPAAVICRPDQQEMNFWRAYTEAVAVAGVTRVVFQSSQIEQARAWAESSARLWHRARLKRQQEKSSLDDVPLFE